MSGRRSRPARARLRLAAAAILRAGLDAADPARLVHQHLRLERGRLRAGGHAWRLGSGRLVLAAAGKAASRMAQAAEDVLRSHLDEALVVDVAADVPLARARRIVAGHPLPDERGLRAAAQLEALAQGLGRDDLLLVLLSGGASALLPAPAAGLTLADKAAATSCLMRAGASIHELNTLRKHLSRLKGGGLARLAWPARVIGLVLSDVVGDDLSTIASGPLSPDPTTFADALRIVTARGVLRKLPRAVRAHLAAGARGARAETPKPGDALFARIGVRVIGSNRLSVAAAARQARLQGFRPLVLTTRLEGEAREVARALTAVLRECVESGRPARRPVCLLAGGETTVSVRGDGHGGRNQELVAAAIAPLAAFEVPALVASLASDGVDGRSHAAGGYADDTSLARALAAGLRPEEFLARSDSQNLLAALDDLIVTGPTGTNVVDLALLLA